MGRTLIRFGVLVVHVTDWYDYVDPDAVDLDQYGLDSIGDSLVRTALRQARHSRSTNDPHQFLDYYGTQLMKAQRVIAQLEQEARTPEALPPAEATDDEAGSWMHLSKEEIRNRASEEDA